MNSKPCKITRLPAVSSVDTGVAGEHALISKARRFRLDTLQISPGSFASRYDEEILAPIEHTRKRLSHSLATQYVAVAPQHSDSNASLSETEWMGTLVVYGPKSETPTDRAQFSFQPLDKPEEKEVSLDSHSNDDVRVSAQGQGLYYHLFGLFVSPQARGQGLGRALIKAAMEDARANGVLNGALEVRVTIALTTDNIDAMRLYQQCGFVVIEQGLFQPKPIMAVDQDKQEYAIMQCSMPLVCS